MTEEPPLRFELEWEPTDESVQAPELRASWSRLEVWVREECVTLVEDRPTKSYRRSIRVPLYPLAEWLAFNWWILRFDGRDDHRGPHVGRRNMMAAGDGYLWPNLRVFPAGELVRLLWHGRPPDNQESLRYVSRGDNWLPADEVFRAFSNLIQDVVFHLEEAGIRDTPLQREWSATWQLDSDEIDFCAASARLGLDPFSEGLDLADELEAVVNRLPADIVGDFLDAAPADRLAQEAQWVEKALTSAASLGPPSPTFGLALVEKVLHRSSSEGITFPYRQGYSAARELRERLQLADTDHVPDEMPVRRVMADEATTTFVGTGSRSIWDSVNLVMGHASGRQSQRFASARAMWHAAEPRGAREFLLTKSRSARQRAGRAFAAELLAPAEGIRQRLSGDISYVDSEEIEEVAEHFDVSAMVIDHQIRNQLLLPA